MSPDDVGIWNESPEEKPSENGSDEHECSTVIFDDVRSCSTWSPDEVGISDADEVGISNEQCT
jgi:hypothetical protein